MEYVNLDLSNLQNVKNCIETLKKYNGIDILINNAAVYNVPISVGETGYNNVFEINFIHTYYFTKKLIGELEKKEKSICITIGSIAYNYSKINEADIDFTKTKKSSKIYGNSKRFLMFSLFDLFENKKTRLAIVHPGITLTNMTSHYHKMINWIVKFGVRVLFPSPKKAALNIMWAINHYPEKYCWIGPKIFNIWGKPKISKIKNCEEFERKIICKITEKIYQKIDK